MIKSVIKSVVHIPLRLINFYFYRHNIHTSNKSFICLRRRSPVRIGTGRLIPRNARAIYRRLRSWQSHFRSPAPFLFVFHAPRRCHPDRCRPVADEFVKCLRVCPPIGVTISVFVLSFVKRKIVSRYWQNTFKKWK